MPLTVWLVKAFHALSSVLFSSSSQLGSKVWKIAVTVTLCTRMSDAAESLHLPGTMSHYQVR